MAYSPGATGLSHLPSCFELILAVTVESVQGSQVYLECIWDIGDLEWWHISWSSSRVSSGDRLLLRCEGNTGIPFPRKQGNGP